KAEINKAGYAPANDPTIKIIHTNAGISQPSICPLITMFFPDNWLNAGSSATAAKKAISAATKVINTDSVRNWKTKYLRGEPSTLRTPTSRARFAERAVERFMKLTQAISRIKRAIAENM